MSTLFLKKFKKIRADFISALYFCLLSIKNCHCDIIHIHFTILFVTDVEGDCVDRIIIPIVGILVNIAFCVGDFSVAVMDRHSYCLVRGAYLNREVVKRACHESIVIVMDIEALFGVEVTNALVVVSSL